MEYKCEKCGGKGQSHHGLYCKHKQSKKILDACCGGRQFWFDKKNHHVLFADIREMEPTVVGNGKDARVRKCLPDKVMDFRKMDLQDKAFKLVVFDPPHLFLGEKSYMAQSYGRLDKETWKSDLRKGFSECFRVLEDEGILIFKWNECDVPLKEVLKLTPYKPLFGHPSGKAQKTHWLCFMKIPKAGGQSVTSD
jgi:SAM-dependent methyltransferase